MNIFDSHAHYDDRAFESDRDAVLRSLAEENVRYIVDVGCDLPSSRKAVAIAEQYPFAYAAVGVHPQFCEDMIPMDLTELSKLLKNPRVRAIGEIGLDYHYGSDNKMAQMECFASQLELAQREKVPVIIHEREAARDCLDIVRQFNLTRGVYHCYSGSAETAQELYARGFYLSFTGVITYNNARRAVEVLRDAPRDRIMIETDSPYLTPEPYRGKRNNSAMLNYTVAKLAEIWEIKPAEAAQITYDNAMRFFGI